MPEKVQDLRLQQAPEQDLAITLSWKPPENLKSPKKDISHYYVRVSSKLSSQVVQNVEVEGSKTEVEFLGKDGLEPLTEYIFSVQAMSTHRVLGDWNMTEGLISEFGL